MFGIGYPYPSNFFKTDIDPLKQIQGIQCGNYPVCLQLCILLRGRGGQAPWPPKQGKNSCIPLLFNGKTYSNLCISTCRCRRGHQDCKPSYNVLVQTVSPSILSLYRLQTTLCGQPSQCLVSLLSESHSAKYTGTQLYRLTLCPRQQTLMFIQVICFFFLKPIQKLYLLY